MQRLTLGIACVALFAAVGGPGYAKGLTIDGLQIDHGKISGSEIKTRSLPASKLTKSALKQLKGNVGPAGPAGSDASVGIRYVVGPDTTIAAGQTKYVDMTCPIGMFAVGGGTGTLNTSVDMFGQLESNLGTYSAWTLHFRNTDGNHSQTVYPYAVCIRGSQI